MAKGSPDWSVASDVSNLQVNVDLIRTNSVLGSLVQMYKTGEVVYVFNALNGINDLEVGGSGSNWEVVPSAEMTVSKDLSLLMVTDGTAYSNVYIIKRMAFTTDTAYGVELCFLPKSNISRVEFDIVLYYSTETHRFSIRYNLSNGYMYAMNYLGDYEYVGNVGTICSYDTCFSYLKLVVDILADEYKYIYVNHTLLDDIMFPCYVYSGGDTEHLEFTFNVVQNDIASASLFLSSIIITNNETKYILE